MYESQAHAAEWRKRSKKQVLKGHVWYDFTSAKLEIIKLNNTEALDGRIVTRKERKGVTDADRGQLWPLKEEGRGCRGVARSAAGDAVFRVPGDGRPGIHRLGVLRPHTHFKGVHLRRLRI